MATTRPFSGDRNTKRSGLIPSCNVVQHPQKRLWCVVPSRPDLRGSLAWVSGFRARAAGPTAFGLRVCFSPPCFKAKAQEDASRLGSLCPDFRFLHTDCATHLFVFEKNRARYEKAPCPWFAYLNLTAIFEAPGMYVVAIW